MSGTDHIEMHLTTAKAMVADFFVFLDNDQAGITAVNNAQKKGLLLPADYMLTTYTDLVKDSEMEDMLDPELYRDEIEKQYGVDMSVGKFKAKNKKWSDRIRDVFNDGGKVIDDDRLSEVKLKVAQIVTTNTERALRPEGISFITKLVNNLEKKLQ